MAKPKTSIPKIVGYLIDYAPVLATVVIATFASLSAVRSGIPTEDMLQWILLILTLLATTQLVDRLRIMKNIDSKVDQIVNDSQFSQGAASFFIDRIPNMEQRILSAKSVSISGITLSRTSDSFSGTFKRKLSQGCKIRVLVVDPEHEAIGIAASRFYKHQNPEKLRRESEHALDNFESLLNENNTSEKFHVKLAQFVPPYGIWLIDENSPNADIWVEIYSYRDEPEPSFHLLPRRDGEWFTFFQRQFEIMWSASKAWNPIVID